MSLLSSSYPAVVAVVVAGESDTAPVKQVALPLSPGQFASTGQLDGNVNSKAAPPKPNS